MKIIAGVSSAVLVAGLLGYPMSASSDRPDEPGNLPIASYSPKQYEDAAQIWSAVQDVRGVMYFGGYRYIVVFDGQKWGKIPVPKGPVRSLEMGSDGRIYVGLGDDFGYVAVSAQGMQIYVSLAHKLPPEHRGFGDIWSIHDTSHGVYFSASSKIFRWSQGRVEVFAISGGMAFSVNDSLYVMDSPEGVNVISNGRLTIAPFFGTGDQAKKVGRSQIFPWSEDKALITTRNAGAYLLDVRRFESEAQELSRHPESYSSLVVPFPTQADGYLGKYPVYCGARLSNEHIALGTIGGGIAILDRQGGLTRIIKNVHGLAGDSVFSLFPDQSGNLWAGTSKGISHISLNSQVTFFDKRNGIEEAVTSVIRHDRKLYVAALDKILLMPSYHFTDDEEAARLRPVEVESGQPYFWTLHHYRGALLCTSNNAIVQLAEQTGRIVHPVAGQSISLNRCSRFPDHLYIGMRNGIEVAQLSLSTDGIPDKNSGQDQPTKPLVIATKVENKEIEKVVGQFYELTCDHKGDLWASSLNNGIFHFKWHSDRFEDFSIFHYGTDDGLPEMADMVAFELANQILVFTAQGIYKAVGANEPDDGNNRLTFEPMPEFASGLDLTGFRAQVMLQDSNDNIWVTNGSRAGFLVQNTDGSYSWDTRATAFISSIISASYIDDDNSVWIGTSEGLYRYDRSQPKNYHDKYSALIGRVSTSQGETLSEGVYFDPKTREDELYTGISLDQPAETIMNLPYSSNSIAFQFSAPFFESPERTTFRYKLSGFDKLWSQWSKTLQKEYTNLPEGHYTFAVQAKNIYGHESRTASFTFNILAPWYRTIWAYLGYVFFATAFLVGVVRIYNWRLIVSRRKLQRIVKERTAEVVLQKEEIEQQRDKIKQVNEALWGEMELAKKIQTVLLPVSPRIPGYEITGYMRTADEVGGDYYDVINIDEKNWLVIGDVSGHGVPAGLVMMMVQTALDLALREKLSESPADVLRAVNSTIFENIKKLGESKYMTLTLMSLEADGAVCYSGLHQNIMVYRQATEHVEIVETQGIWLGITDRIDGLNLLEKFHMEPGDTMLLFTDGIIEAEDSDKRLYGDDKLKSIFEECGFRPTTEIRDHILDSLNGYTTKDDVTMMVVKRMQAD